MVLELRLTSLAWADVSGTSSVEITMGHAALSRAFGGCCERPLILMRMLPFHHLCDARPPVMAAFFSLGSQNTNLHELFASRAFTLETQYICMSHSFYWPCWMALFLRHRKFECSWPLGKSFSITSSGTACFVRQADVGLAATMLF